MPNMKKDEVKSKPNIEDKIHIPLMRSQAVSRSQVVLCVANQYCCSANTTSAHAHAHARTHKAVLVSMPLK